MAKAKKKYYAVRQGRTTGILLNWDDCKASVTGYPGAIYKSFESITDAEAFLNNTEGEKKDVIMETPSSYDAGERQEHAVAYVDGSFNIATFEYSCGVVILYKGEEIKFNEKFSDPDMAEMRNVAGEIEGSMAAMKYCMEKGIKELDIYYDYAGIREWCVGGWKTNREGTKAYKEFYMKAREELKISFVKVKGHSGDKYNDMADRLAKDALGIS